MFSIGYIEYCVPLSLRADWRDNDAPVSVTQRFCRPGLLDLAKLKRLESAPGGDYDDEERV